MNENVNIKCVKEEPNCGDGPVPSQYDLIYLNFSRPYN